MVYAGVRCGRLIVGPFVGQDGGSKPVHYANVFDVGIADDSIFLVCIHKQQVLAGSPEISHACGYGALKAQL